MDPLDMKGYKISIQYFKSDLLPFHDERIREEIFNTFFILMIKSGNKTLKKELIHMLKRNLMKAQTNLTL